MRTEYKHSTQRVPFSMIEPLLLQLIEKYGVNQTKILHTLGYNSSNGIAYWRSVNSAPLVAFNACKGLLAEVNGELPQTPQAPVFDFKDICVMLAAVTGSDITETQRRHLIRKLAAELAR